MLNSSRNARWMGVLVLVVASLAFGGCATTAHNGSSIADYLYPNPDDMPAPTVPVLKVPLRLGIAFVPDHSKTASRTIRVWSPGSAALIEYQKAMLMREVAEHFEKSLL